MKKDIEKISNDIFIIKNFISKETCKFISQSFKKNLIETDRDFIMGGPSSNGFSALNWVGEYNQNLNFNISVDILNGVTSLMSNVLSYKFNKKIKCKQCFYGVMMPGSNNDLHMDNYLIKKDGSIVPRENNSNDISGLLYFNDDYTGGMLEFPNQGLSIKPEIGSFIFFIGDQNKPHLVTEIESGSRDVYITFYEPVD